MTAVSETELVKIFEPLVNLLPWQQILNCLRVTFCKTETPEIHDPLLICLIFGTSVYHDKKFMSANFSLLAHLLSKLQHLKKCFNFRPNYGFYDQPIEVQSFKT